MSRTPDRAGAELLRDTLHRHRLMCKEIANLKAAAAKLPELERKASETHKQIIDLLESMDCKQSGNSGWESRITWLLSEMLSQEAKNL